MKTRNFFPGQGAYIINPHKPGHKARTFPYHDEWLTMEEITERSPRSKSQVWKYMRQFGWTAEQVIDGK
jgi:hypothetical protein